jgi:DNA-binding MarR family transcriptional regulator
MTGKIQQEIQQSKPFPSLSVEAYLNLLRTADVLRILRGAEPTGAKCSEIAARMITRDPDVTRLLDRMESLGLVRRARSAEDRRVVTVRITDAGLRLLRRLDRPIVEVHERQFGHLGERRLRQLIGLLEHLRSASRQDS